MNSLLQDRISMVGQQVRNRLDRLADIVPQAKPPRAQPPFEEYLAKAQAMAARDPAFKTRLEQALQQYGQVAKEVQNATAR